METNFAEANVYELEGKNVRITYQRTRMTEGEQVHYMGTLGDMVELDLTFKEVEGEIEVLESKIGKMLTVELNPEDPQVDGLLKTLTLLVPQVSLKDQRSSLETQVILTTHAFPRRGFPGGPHQLYEVVPLKGTAFHAD
jgi:hypothetical protein